MHRMQEIKEELLDFEKLEVKRQKEKQILVQKHHNSLIYVVNDENLQNPGHMVDIRHRVLILERDFDPID